MRTAFRGLPLFTLPFAAAVCVACGAPAKAAAVAPDPQGQQRLQLALDTMEECLRRAGYRLVGPPTGESGSVNLIVPDESDRDTRSDPGYAAAYHRCAKQTVFAQPAATAGVPTP